MPPKKNENDEIAKEKRNGKSESNQRIPANTSHSLKKKNIILFNKKKKNLIEKLLCVSERVNGVCFNAVFLLDVRLFRLIFCY